MTFSGSEPRGETTIMNGTTGNRHPLGWWVRVLLVVLVVFMIVAIVLWAGGGSYTGGTGPAR